MSTESTPIADRKSVEQMTLEELQQEYVFLMTTQFKLTAESNALDEEIEELRNESVRMQQSAEVEGEHATLQLIRRIDGTSRDRRKYQGLLKEEEGELEVATETMRQCREQQTELEGQLRQQQEYLLEQLQKKLMSVSDRKMDLERELMAERQRYLETLFRLLATIRKNDCEGASGASGSGIDTPNTDAAPAHSAAPPPSSPSSSSSPEPAAAAAETAAQHPPITHAEVVEVEQRLNRVLLDHSAAMQASMETKERCAVLTERLKNIQDAAFLDRARALRMRDDLRDVRRRLAEVKLADSMRMADASTEESGSFVATPSLSLDHSYNSTIDSMSLRERTREVLSTAPLPQPVGLRNPRQEYEGRPSSESSSHASMP